MPSTKNSTPPVSEHPALSLKIGTADDQMALAKLSPTTMPNDALVASLQKSHPNDPRWHSFRNDYRYIYVTNWMYQCRGYLKLASENFDVDLFEIELFNLVSPPPVDDSALLVNRAKLALISKIHGKKVSSLAMFESLFRVYFGNQTPLSGPDIDYSDDMVQPDDNTTYPTFDDLFIDEKFEILYIMISEVTQYPDFREYLDKAKLYPEELRLDTIYSSGGRNTEEYTLAFDDTALYKRTIKAPELSIPKKRKLAPTDPEDYYGPDAFDAASVTFELVFKDVYGLNALLSDLKGKRDKKSKQITDGIKSPAFISNVFAYELRKRRFLASRKKELEVARLFAIRKRSSRIEAKEKQKYQEEQERKARELQDLQYAASRRSSRNHTRTQSNLLKMDYTAGLTREQRLNMRKDKTLTEFPVTPSLEDNSLEVESTPIVIEDEQSDPVVVDKIEANDETLDAPYTTVENPQSQVKPEESTPVPAEVPSADQNNEQLTV